jgi:hypothetical protein
MSSPLPPLASTNLPLEPRHTCDKWTCRGHHRHVKHHPWSDTPALANVNVLLEVKKSAKSPVKLPKSQTDCVTFCPSLKLILWLFSRVSICLRDLLSLVSSVLWQVSFISKRLCDLWPKLELTVWPFAPVSMCLIRLLPESNLTTWLFAWVSDRVCDLLLQSHLITWPVPTVSEGPHDLLTRSRAPADCMLFGPSLMPTEWPFAPVSVSSWPHKFYTPKWKNGMLRSYVLHCSLTNHKFYNFYEPTGLWWQK